MKVKIAPVAHHWQHTFFRIFTISADTQVIEDLRRLFDDVVAEHNVRNAAESPAANTIVAQRDAVYKGSRLVYPSGPVEDRPG